MNIRGLSCFKLAHQYGERGSLAHPRSSDAAVHPMRPLPGGPGPVFHARMLYFGVAFPRPQENTVYNIPTVVVTKWVPCPPPPVLSNWGLSLPMMLSGSGFRKKREEKRRPVLPNHTVRRSSDALFPIQGTPPSHSRPRDLLRGGKSFPWAAQSSSTEVIKHGWFVVIDAVILPWTDPQTLKSTPLIIF